MGKTATVAPDTSSTPDVATPEGAEKLYGSYADKKLSFGARVKKPGHIHLNEGEFVEGQLLAIFKPLKFKQPVVQLLIKNELFQCSANAKLLDMLSPLCDHEDLNGRRSATAQPWVRIVYQGEQERPNGTTLHMFAIFKLGGAPIGN